MGRKEVFQLLLFVRPIEDGSEKVSVEEENFIKFASREWGGGVFSHVLHEVDGDVVGVAEEGVDGRIVCDGGEGDFDAGVEILSRGRERDFEEVQRFVLIHRVDGAVGDLREPGALRMEVSHRIRAEIDVDDADEDMGIVLHAQVTIDGHAETGLCFGSLIDDGADGDVGRDEGALRVLAEAIPSAVIVGHEDSPFVCD